MIITTFSLFSTWNAPIKIFIYVLLLYFQLCLLQIKRKCMKIMLLRCLYHQCILCSISALFGQTHALMRHLFTL